MSTDIWEGGNNRALSGGRDGHRQLGGANQSEIMENNSDYQQSSPRKWPCAGVFIRMDEATLDMASLRATNGMGNEACSMTPSAV
jgi:hypothetical protein